MSGGIHYEVHLKKNRKAGWALYEAREDRDQAIRLAHSLLAKNKEGSVRVTKEKFDEEERVFRAVPIFEGGQERLQAVEEKTAEATLPCLTPDDLAKAMGRDAIRRCLSQFLERIQALPMELLHRPDLVETLEASDTEMQHAVQKYAIARAQGSDASVHGYVKQLNELVQKALSRIYKDSRNKKLPEYAKSKSFKDVAGDIHKTDARPYMLRAAIANRLKSERNYGNKLEVLLDMLEDLPAEEEARDFAIAELDSFLSEVISFDSGQDALLGSRKDLGETLERLTCLFDGDHSADALSMATGAAKRMARRIAHGELDECKGKIAQTLLRELEKPKRLRPSSVKQEVRLARELAQKLVMSAGPDLPLDALNSAFQARSARLLQPENIDELLRHSRDPDEEIDRLMMLEENLVGEENKRKLAGFVRSVLGQHQTESWYMRGDAKPLERLSALAGHQRRVLKGGYPDAEKAQLAGCFDTIGMKVIDETKILNAVEAGDRPALEKAVAMLKLATAGALPEGQCTADAQARALRHLKSQMGLSEARSEEAKPKLRAIQSMLGQIAAQGKAA